jgi:hypothetical protein
MISTSDKEIFSALVSGVPEGVKASVLQTRAAEIESIVRVVISFASDVAVGVFSAWLYDRMKDRGSEKTTIEGRDVPRDIQQITIIINNTLQQHQQQSQDGHGKDS